MDALVGYTGFVGSNLAASHRFSSLYNSSNIRDAFGSKPDLLVYSGLRAEKFIANKFPQQDRNSVEVALENILRISPARLVLISTIDVYDNPIGVNESSTIDKDMLKPYGLNRLWLEEIVTTHVEDSLIVRLPGLYGKNLKKNFIYDMMNRVPQLLNERKLDELEALCSGIKAHYAMDENGFFKLTTRDPEKKNELEKILGITGFSSLSFTDSRASFQFYNLSNLWGHIEPALENGLKKINLATEPVRADELYEHVFGGNFENLLNANPPKYDFRTSHNSVLGGEGGYIFDKCHVMEEIRGFILGGDNR